MGSPIYPDGTSQPDQTTLAVERNPPLEAAKRDVLFTGHLCLWETFLHHETDHRKPFHRKRTLLFRKRCKQALLLISRSHCGPLFCFHVHHQDVTPVRSQYRSRLRPTNVLHFS